MYSVRKLYLSGPQIVRKKFRRDRYRPILIHHAKHAFPQVRGGFQQRPAVTGNHQYKAESFRFNV
jgi:hypothetical protein